MADEHRALRGRVVTPDRVLDDGAVVLAGPTIAWVGPADEAAAAGHGAVVAAAPSPADGRLVLPGLVDLHCHGGGGASFPDAEDAPAALRAVAEHRRHGTTTLLASLVTATPGTLRARVGLLADLADAGEIDGIHLEGPFLSPVRCGAQDPALLQAPDLALDRRAPRPRPRARRHHDAGPRAAGQHRAGRRRRTPRRRRRAAVLGAHRRRAGGDPPGPGRVCRAAARHPWRPCSAPHRDPPVQRHAPAAPPRPRPRRGVPRRRPPRRRRRRAHRRRHPPRARRGP